MLRVHCEVPETWSGTPPHLHRVSVIKAIGKHPAPFRTRKLSLSAPMVLHGGPCGRLGRRRTITLQRRPPARGRPRRTPTPEPARLWGGGGASRQAGSELAAATGAVDGWCSWRTAW